MEEDLHGFLILKKLYASNVMDYSGLDPTGLYRTLKKMEKDGLLTSRIDVESETQARRTYKITSEGKICLIFWIDTLKEYMKRVDALTNAIRLSVITCPEYREREEGE